MKNKKETRGGKCTPSLGKKIGRPRKEPTRVLNFRVPVKDYDRLKVLLSEYLAFFTNNNKNNHGKENIRKESNSKTIQ